MQKTVCSLSQTRTDCDDVIGTMKSVDVKLCCGMKFMLCIALVNSNCVDCKVKPVFLNPLETNNVVRESIW